MATILNAYDLTGGDTNSSAITSASNETIHWVWGGTQAGTIKVTFKAKEDASLGYVSVKDELRKEISFVLYASKSDHLEDRFTVYGVNSSSMIISVEPSADATGTFTIYSYSA